MGEIVIDILPDGSIQIEGKAIDLAQLKVKLASITTKLENQPVRIRGDGAVEYQRIVEVIDSCHGAGISNISFATQSPAPSN